MTKQKQYIDRNALLRQAETMFDGQREVMGVKAEHIYSAPAADVAEVVRCEDCEHWKNYRTGLFNVKVGDCHNNDFPFHCESRPITRATDFCSFGERKQK